MAARVLFGRRVAWILIRRGLKGELVRLLLDDDRGPRRWDNAEVSKRLASPVTFEVNTTTGALHHQVGA